MADTAQASDLSLVLAQLATSAAFTGTGIVLPDPTDCVRLASLNGIVQLVDVNKIYVGQVLRVPPISPTVTPIPSTPIPPTVIPTYAELPALGGSGEPPKSGCSVVRNIGINDVIIHTNINGRSAPVAKLATYLPLYVEANLAYEVILQGYPDNLGWVWKEHTHLVGTGCRIGIVLPTEQPVEPPMKIPVLGNQGQPPANSCSVQQSPTVEAAFVYRTSDDFSSLIGQVLVGQWLPFHGITASGVIVTLSDGRKGWMPDRDIDYVGTNCPLG